MANHHYLTQLNWAREGVVPALYLDSPMLSAGDTTVWYILSGKVEVKYGSERIETKAGQWLFHRNENGWQTFEAGTRLLSIRFMFRHYGMATYYSRKREIVFASQQHPQLLKKAKALVRIVATQYDDGFVNEREPSPLQAFTLENAFNAWLVEYIKTMDAMGEPSESHLLEDARLNKALKLIDHFPPQRKFIIADIAREVEISQNQLNRLFRQHLKVSVHQYYERRRLEAAKRYLSNPALLTKEVAFRLGFSSQGHFSYWFKKYAGITPATYRKQSAPVS